MDWDTVCNSAQAWQENAQNKTQHRPDTSAYGLRIQIVSSETPNSATSPSCCLEQRQPPHVVSSGKVLFRHRPTRQRRPDKSESTCTFRSWRYKQPESASDSVRRSPKYMSIAHMTTKTLFMRWPRSRNRARKGSFSIKAGGNSHFWTTKCLMSFIKINRVDSNERHWCERLTLRQEVELIHVKERATRYTPAKRMTYVELFCVLMDTVLRSVVKIAVWEHQPHISSKVHHSVVSVAVQFRPDSAEIHWILDNFSVVFQLQTLAKEKAFEANNYRVKNRNSD